MDFAAVVDKIPSGYGVGRGGDVLPGEKERTGKGAGFYLSLSTKEGEAVTIKAGLSYTSIENARLNLESEARRMDFDEARQQSHRTWNSYLGRIRVETPKRDGKVKFYTGLYHALLGRGLASDVNGAYPGNNGSVGTIPLDRRGRPLSHTYNTDATSGAR